MKYELDIFILHNLNKTHSTSNYSAMKISAIDIRKHTFEKIFRGYDPEAVDAFLNSLSQEWERYTSENNQLRSQLEYSEKELAKLKDIETSLFRMLKTAEDTGRQIEKEAAEAAKITKEDSEKQASDLIAEAENRTNKVIQDTENRLSDLKEDFALEIKNQERDFRAIENFRDNLIVQLSSLANSTSETVTRFDQKYDKDSVLNKMDEIKKHVSEIVIPKKEMDVVIPPMETTNENIVKVVKTEEVVTIIEEISFQNLPNSGTQEEDIQDVTAADIEIQVPPTRHQPDPKENKPEEKTVKKSIADEANEALNTMHKTAERARENVANSYRNTRNQDQNASKEESGGSFFDQI